MNPNSLSVYVATAITDAPEKHFDFVKSFIGALREVLQVNLFYSLAVVEDPKVKDIDLYGFNYNQVRRSITAWKIISATCAVNS